MSINLQHLKKMAKESNGTVEANSTWTIPATEFAFTAVTSGYAWLRGRKSKKRRR